MDGFEENEQDLNGTLVTAIGNKLYQIGYYEEEVLFDFPGGS